MQYFNEPTDQPEQDPLVGDIRALLDQPPVPAVDRTIRQAYRDMLGQTQPEVPQRTGLWRQWCDLLVSRHRDLLFGTVAASLLLGVATGVLLPVLWQNSEPKQAVIADILQTRGGAVPAVSSIHSAIPAEEWLESIAELLLQGRVSEARKQLAQFEVRYPEPIFTKGAQK